MPGIGSISPGLLAALAERGRRPASSVSIRRGDKRGGPSAADVRNRLLWDKQQSDERQRWADNQRADQTLDIQRGKMVGDLESKKAGLLADLQAQRFDQGLKTARLKLDSLNSANDVLEFMRDMQQWAMTTDKESGETPFGSLYTPEQGMQDYQALMQEAMSRYQAFGGAPGRADAVRKGGAPRAGAGDGAQVERGTPPTAEESKVANVARMLPPEALEAIANSGFQITGDNPVTAKRSDGSEVVWDNTNRKWIPKAAVQRGGVVDDISRTELNRAPQTR